MNWITSGQANDKHNRLPPELFRKSVAVRGELAGAVLKATAMGIYEAEINGKKVGDCYFAPGYTHYESYVQVQTYDVTELLEIGENTLDLTVANGWWLGTLGNKNNRYGKMRGLCAELILTYTDGRIETVITDESWMVTQDTSIRFADFYNGENIDLTREHAGGWKFTPVRLFQGKAPELRPHFGAYVKVDCRLVPVSINGSIYDFGQKIGRAHV